MTSISSDSNNNRMSGEASRAFLILDGLVADGTLHSTRSQALRNKYKKLHDRLSQIYANDSLLIERAKELRKDLETERLRVEKCGDVAKQDDTAIMKLKRELSVSENELAVAQERVSMDQMKIIEWERMKMSLQNEISEAIDEQKAHLLPQIEAVQEVIASHRAELASHEATIQKLGEERDALEATQAKFREDMQAAENRKKDLKLMLARTEVDPERAKKHAEVAENGVSTGNFELGNIRARLADITKDFENAERVKLGLESEVSGLEAATQEKARHTQPHQHRVHQQELTLASDRQANVRLETNIAQLEQTIKQLDLDLAKQRDVERKYIKEQETAMKLNVKLEKQLEALGYEKIEKSKPVVQLKNDLVAIKKELQEAKRNLENSERRVDIFVSNYLRQEGIVENTREQIGQLQTRYTEHVTELKRLTEEGVSLEKQLSIAQGLRTQRLKLSRSARTALSTAGEELRLLEAKERESHRKAAELQTKLAHVTDVHCSVKAERGKKLAAIQQASQTVAEVEEKLNIVKNELSVLRRDGMLKDKNLQKMRREVHDDRAVAEAVRVENHALVVTLKERRRVVLDVAAQVTKLSSSIEGSQKDMEELREKYAKGVEHRNFVGVQLIDRNDEMCLLYEKQALQESKLEAVRNQCRENEEQSRRLNVQLSDLRRKVNLKQRQVPEVQELDAKIAASEETLKTLRENVVELEAAVMDSSNPRFRLLDVPVVHNVASASGEAGDPDASGMDGELDENQLMSLASSDMTALKQQAKELEQRAYILSERCLEKRLVYEEVVDVTAKLKNKYENNKADMRDTTSKVAHYHSAINRASRKMMATLSELSVMQATTLKQEEDLHGKKELLEAARENLTSGEEPIQGTDEEFKLLERDARRRQESIQRFQNRLAAQKTANDNKTDLVRTRAIPRPNAYIPMNDDVSIPRPYGAHGAVLPLSATRDAAARHWKSPQQKPIDILGGK